MNTKPLFRWAGSKTKMRSKYGSNFMPTRDYNRFIDCFFGTGCVSMWMPLNVEIIANDINEDIINIYKNIQTSVHDFCTIVDAYSARYLELSHEDRRSFYYQHRQIHADQYETLSKLDRAALLFFLLKTSFNGIWQINQNTNGRFGTPVGLANEKDRIYNKTDVYAFSEFAQRVTFLTGDFENVKSYITESSFCYFDPPYRDSFTNYGLNDGFTDDDQIRLCKLMNYANYVNALVAMSNKYHFDSFFETHLSSNFEPLLYDVTYTAGRGAKNGEKVKVKECLFRNYQSSSKIDDFF